MDGSTTLIPLGGRMPWQLLAVRAPSSMRLRAKAFVSPKPD